MPDLRALGRLLQLGSANLPVGAFSYSEGLETLVQQGHLQAAPDLRSWLEQHLHCGPIRVEAAILHRLLHAAMQKQANSLEYWDAWLAASRESEELALQNRHMARALWRLLRELAGPDALPVQYAPSQYASVFALFAVVAELPIVEAIFTYMHSWLANLIVAGVRLMPLGQSAGQTVLWELQDSIEQVVEFATSARDEDLFAWNSGLAIASMQHESLYSRLYRS
ncbi:urease accessory protein UreF [Acidithiobacillus sp. IBUN Pt1247-S3]|uniref:urease accessory protein UreF n=1 Tax=Acidithiobacillus sp. IBUN Pt1247-S3 TaxID=3166642 RepID=UPI0034E49D42